MPSPLRLNPLLIAAATKAGAVQKRTVPKQIEFWAELGRSVERAIDLPDVFAILQGFKKIRVVSVEPVAVSPDVVFDSIEEIRRDGALAEKVTNSSVYYEASKSHPGRLDRVDAVTGSRTTGIFRNGTFMMNE